MKIVCSWCQATISEVENDEENEDPHAICNKCFVRIYLKIKGFE